MEIRWCYHSVADDGPPPKGAIHISGGLYQKLQFRTYGNRIINDILKSGWSDWRDVKFEGAI